VTETEEQYRMRLAGYVEGKNPVAMQQAAPGTLARLIAGVQEEILRRRPAPSKWSVVEILAHLAEDELTSSWRYRQMIEHSGVTLTGFDQDRWAALGNYASWSPRDALEMFRLLREANLRMLSRLKPAEWESEGMHTERGPMTVRDLARHMAAHDINHILQIERILTNASGSARGSAKG
jgi:DinB superfamily